MQEPEARGGLEGWGGGGGTEIETTGVAGKRAVGSEGGGAEGGREEGERGYEEEREHLSSNFFEEMFVAEFEHGVLEFAGV